MAENGFFYRGPSPAAGGPLPAWESLVPLQHADFSWKKMAAPILQQYVESTDGSSVETKESALVWHFRDADPDFGAWQVRKGRGEAGELWQETWVGLESREARGPGMLL